MTDAPSTDRRALLQQALVAIDDLEARLERAEAAGREPVAIVGMSCRFPGGASSLDAYWDLLCSGRDAVGPFPAERLELLRRSGVEPDQLAQAAGWQGGFLEDIDRFDPQFFGVSPREAASMDPQQRMLLEVSWEALEHAGIAPTSLAGTPTGVFVGITSTEYAQLGKLGGPAGLDVYAATGGALNAAAGRVAYTLGLQGPAMAIDTACSSSLVALHEASQALRAGEASVALAAGVNLLLLPEAFICFESWGMMAPDSRCKPFDADADGFVRGEGCGVVVLKLLRDAVADGDRVLAVVRGSAVNQDGASSGLTVPNGPAQAAVVRRALDLAGVAPADVQYFEAHGTGTSLGDPIEVEALGNVLRRGRSADGGLLLGSVKSNIGHLESAAGIAGLIKVVLSMQHGAVPPNLHLTRPNPDIPWPPFPVVVPTEVTPWPAVGGRRVAGLSGFGFSGTNAHVVLESAPDVVDAQPDAADGLGRGPADGAASLVVVSGRTASGLRETASRWAGALDDDRGALRSVAATAARGRAHLTHRAGVVVGSVAELRASLESLASAPDPGGFPAGVVGQAGHPSVGFVMSGQGSQHLGMGRTLYQVEPVFREALDRCAVVWDRVVAGRGLLDVMWDGDGLDRTEVTQPALFALEWALTRVWESWGVVPAAVLGHSVGEYVAAVTAGVMSPEDGLALVAARGRLMGELPPGGAMAAVMAPRGAVEEVLASLPSGDRGAVTVAAVNGSAHTVVSGAQRSVASVTAVFTERGVRVSQLVVSHAFHSPLMEPMVERFGEEVARVGLSAPSRRLVSNVTGEVAGAEITDPAYWVNHVLAPVRFADGVSTMRDLGVGLFVEIGPHPVLVGMATADAPPDGERWVGSLRRGRDDHGQILAALAEVHVAGAPVAWDGVVAAGAGAPMAELPPTPFRRDRHWFPPVAPRSLRPSGTHPLLGVRVEAPSLRVAIHESQIAAESPPWLVDHHLAGTVVFPGSAYLDMLLAVSDRSAEVVDQVQILEALVLDGDEPVTLQTVVERSADGRQVQIVSVRAPLDPGGEPRWTVHARASLRSRVVLPSEDPLDVAGLSAAFPDPVDVDAYYQLLRDIGLTYGPTFRGLVELHRRDGAAVGRAVLPAAARDVRGHHLHPGLLDACFQVLGVAVAPIDGHDAEDMLIPVAVDGLRVLADAGDEAWCVVTVLSNSGPTIAAKVELFDPSGQPLATIDRLEVRRTPKSAWNRASAGRHLYELVWRGHARPEPSEHTTEQGSVLVVGDATAAVLADGLSGAAEAVVHWDGTDLGREISTRSAVSPVTDVVVVVPPGRAAAEVLDRALVVAHALVEVPRDLRLWLVSRGGQSVEGEAPDPAQAALWGFGRVLANEHPHLDCRLVDLDPSGAADDVDDLTEELRGASSEGSSEAVAFRSGRRTVARLVRGRIDRLLPPRAPYRLDLPERGSLDGLAVRTASRGEVGPGEIEVELRATGINFRDVLNVLGMLPGDPGPPGLECAGVVTTVGGGVGGVAPGDRVMGIAARAYDSHVITSPDLVVPIPEGLSFADAATVPIAFLTADYGLRRLADLQPGERVLVHAAAGGVGQAAVQIALGIGAEVHATVGSPEKRRVLEAMGVRHIYGSRSLDFADEVLAATDGAGVDVVLNSLSDEFVDRSFQVLAAGGRFLEIGKRGIWSVEDAAIRRPDASYHLYDLADFLAVDAADLGRSLATIAEQLADGSLRPLPVRAFPVREIDSAFRFMAQARHIGKVVVVHRPSPPEIRPDGAYLVTGGLGGLGLTVAEWLVDQGAPAVVLAGRRAPTAGAVDAVAALRARGADVRVVAADIGVAADVERLLAEVEATGADLRGIFHAAGTTDDGAVVGQTAERIAAVLAPKLTGAELLDAASRGLDLDHFVLFSSASAFFGAPGQSGYAAANAGLDAVALRRRSVGRPALTIDWGAWAEVGMAARLDDREQQRMAARGVGRLAPAEALDALDGVLASDAAQMVVADLDWSALLSGFPEGEAPQLFAEVGNGPALGEARDAADVPDVRAGLAAAGPDERRALIEEFVRSQIVGVLALDPEDEIDPRQGLTDIGMDSLMAVELGNRLRSGLGISFSSTVAFEHPTLLELTDHVLVEITGPGDGGPARPRDVAEASRPSAALEEVVALTEDEVADRLLQELEESGY